MAKLLATNDSCSRELSDLSSKSGVITAYKVMLCELGVVCICLYVPSGLCSL